MPFVTVASSFRSFPFPSVFLPVSFDYLLFSEKLGRMTACRWITVTSL